MQKAVTVSERRRQAAIILYKAWQIRIRKHNFIVGGRHMGQQALQQFLRKSHCGSISVKEQIVRFLRIGVYVVQFKVDFIFEDIRNQLVTTAHDAALEIAQRAVAVKLEENVFFPPGVRVFYQRAQALSLTGRGLDIKIIAECRQDVQMADGAAYMFPRHEHRAAAGCTAACGLIPRTCTSSETSDESPASHRGRK